MRFLSFCNFAQLIEIFGHLGTSGRFVNFAINPFDYVHVSAETALIAHSWQAGVMLLSRARSIARMVVITTG